MSNMHMGKVEKFFVNSPSKGRRVSKSADRLLSYADVRPGHRYLDVGCGNGAAAIHVARAYSLDVTGVDVDPGQIRLAEEIARGVERARFLAESATQLPFQDGEFDIVFTSKAMHHIPNWKDAVVEMSRVLKPDGYLLYTDMVFPRWMAALGEKFAADRGGYPTLEALNALVEQIGLARVHVARVFLGYDAVFHKVPR